MENITPQNLSVLKIHKLSEAQYRDVAQSDDYDPYALYITPDEGEYALQTELDILSDYIGKLPDTTENDEDFKDVNSVIEYVDAKVLKAISSLSGDGSETAANVGARLDAHINTNHAVNNAQVNVIEKITFKGEELGVNEVKSVSLDDTLANNAFLDTESNENFILTDETNQKIASAVRAALTAAKLSGEFDGADGRTPIAGTDYFTSSEKNEMVEAVLNKIPIGNEVEY